jgi:fumarylacetoacetate (FAA) hydrolase family protein
MFVPSKDRGEKGKGFTHKTGDRVTISTPALGALVNRVRLSPDCPPWTYGARRLMSDLAAAALL